MVEDAELLRRYTEEGAQDAFAELVNRHLGLVYFGALRRTSDAHLAADVCQTVFIAMARNARRLRSHPALQGWLFAVTKNTAINLQLAQKRRQQREQEALMTHDSSTNEERAVDWERLRPLLYDTLDVLSERDRQAVLLRFFGGRSFGEIGRALQLTEENARKRVERAMQTLQAALSRRGITSTMAAITGALSAEAMAQPPLALIGNLAATAAGTMTGTAGSLSFLLMAKIKIGIIGTVATAGFIAVLMEFQNARALAAEFDRTRQGTAQFIALRKENENLAGQLAKTTPAVDREELARLRKLIASIRARPAEVDEAKFLPVSQLKNAGWATLDAAFETLMWAQVQDPVTYVDTFSRSFRFHPATKAQADAFFAGLSEESRARFRTPEEIFVPLFLFGMPRDQFVEAQKDSQKDPIIGIQVLGKTNHDNDPDEVRIRWWEQRASGAGFQGSVMLTRVDGEWRQIFRRPFPEQEWQNAVSRIDPQTGRARTGKQ